MNYKNVLDRQIEALQATQDNTAIMKSVSERCEIARTIIDLIAVTIRMKNEPEHKL